MSQMDLSFGERNFAHADLGDQRRTRRLVQVADQMAHRPGGSLPEKINSPKDLKAMYRLFDCETVTHESILDSHRQHLFESVLPSCDGFTLVIHDASEMEYTKRRSLKNLGQIGNGSRRGYIAQNSLMVCPQTGATLGLVNQVLHRRAKVKNDETASQRKKRRSRESLLWLKGVRPLPADRKIVDVCDRGADTSEFIQHEADSGRTFLIRSSIHRNSFVGHDELGDEQPQKLHDYVRTFSEAGMWEMEVTSKVEIKNKNRKGKKRKVTRKKRTAPWPSVSRRFS